MDVAQADTEADRILQSPSETVDELYERLNQELVLRLQLLDSPEYQRSASTWIPMTRWDWWSLILIYIAVPTVLCVLAFL